MRKFIFFTLVKDIKNDKKVKHLFIVLLSFSFGLIGYAQETIPLYKDQIPNSTSYKMDEIPITKADGLCDGFKNIAIPTLKIFLPTKERANGSAVIICPGGGYSIECDQECIAFANQFMKNGVAAFILKYRLPSDSIMVDKTIGSLQDAQQAVKLVRQNAAKWNIDENKVGIFGLSAGGHLAASTGTHFETSFVSNEEKINLRPDFMILVCPVISMTDKLTHHNSRKYLLGENPVTEKIDFFSNEMQVTEKTPPTFLIQAGDDKSVDVDNSIVFYEALRHNNVPAEMHLFPNGGHHFAFIIPAEEFMKPLFLWMKNNNWLQKK